MTNFEAQMQSEMNEIEKLESVAQYNAMRSDVTLHPLVTPLDLSTVKPLPPQTNKYRSSVN